MRIGVIGGKNRLFFTSLQGDAAAMALYTLTATCHRLHIGPLSYLREVCHRPPPLKPVALADADNRPLTGN